MSYFLYNVLLLSNTGYVLSTYVTVGFHLLADLILQAPQFFFPACTRYHLTGYCSLPSIWVFLEHNQNFLLSSIAMSKKKMLKIKEVFNTVTICRTLYFVVLIIPVLTKMSLNQFLSFPPAIPVENSMYCFMVLHHTYNRMYFTLNHVCQNCTLLYLYNSLQCWNKIQYYRVSLSILYTMYINIFILFYPK